MANSVRFEDWMEDAESKKMEVAYQVASLRVKRGLAQAELAAAVGVSGRTISRIEDGSKDPSLNLLRKIADALDGELEVKLVAGRGQ